MTGAVTRLGSKDMETAPMGATIQSMLQGKAPGVNVMDQFGFPDFTGVCYYPGIFFSVG